MKKSMSLRKAEALGKLAYLEGCEDVPAYDRELMKLTQTFTEDESVPVLKAWLDAWYYEKQYDEA